MYWSNRAAEQERILEQKADMEKSEYKAGREAYWNKRNYIARINAAGKAQRVNPYW